MAYQLVYWEKDGPQPDAYAELKHIRLKSVEEAFTLALPHNRPNGCALITLDRHRNYKGKKWIDEKTVWEKGLSEPINPIKRPRKTKR